MTPLFPAHRAAEEFDRVLSGRATDDVAERYADLVATVQVLHAQPDPMPRADFAADLRSRLMTAAETELVAAPAVRRITTAPARRQRRLGAAAAALVIVGGSAGMAAASSGALPGQPLYPVKRGAEQVAAAIQFGQAGKGNALLGDAGTRLQEVAALVAEPSPDSGLVTSTLSAFQGAATSGSVKLFSAYESDSNPADISSVRSFTASAMDQLARLAATHDPAIAGALSDAADTVAQIDQQARTLCVSCGAGAAIAPPAALASAAGAASVDNLLARPTAQASADAAAVRVAQQAQQTALAHQNALQGLSAAAQGAADKLGSVTSGSGTTPRLGGAGAGTSLRNTVTSTGQLVPSITTSGGSAVKGLVAGVTGSLGAASGGGAAAQSLSGLGSGVKKVTDGVGGTLGGVTGGLNP